MYPSPTPGTCASDCQSPGPCPGRPARSITFQAGSLGYDRLNYSSAANFQTQVYQVAIGWAPVQDRSFRLGLGVGIAQTSYYNNNTVSGALNTSTAEPQQFLETIRAFGSDNALIFTVGAQWDLAPGVSLGLIFRPPGIELWNTSLVTTESSNLAADVSTAEYYRDDTGTFRYKLPLEVGVGAAYRFGVFELEADLRYHNSVSNYDFYRGNAPYTVLMAYSNAPTWSRRCRRPWSVTQRSACSTLRSEARRASDASGPCTPGSIRRSRPSQTPPPRRCGRPTSTALAEVSTSSCQSSAPRWAWATSSERPQIGLPRAA